MQLIQSFLEWIGFVEPSASNLQIYSSSGVVRLKANKRYVLAKSFGRFRGGRNFSLSVALYQK